MLQEITCVTNLKNEISPVCYIVLIIYTRTTVQMRCFGRALFVAQPFLKIDFVFFSIYILQCHHVVGFVVLT